VSGQPVPGVKVLQGQQFVDFSPFASTNDNNNTKITWIADSVANPGKVRYYTHEDPSKPGLVVQPDISQECSVFLGMTDYEGKNYAPTHIHLFNGNVFVAVYTGKSAGKLLVYKDGDWDCNSSASTNALTTLTVAPTITLPSGTGGGVHGTFSHGDYLYIAGFFCRTIYWLHKDQITSDLTGPITSQGILVNSNQDGGDATSGNPRHMAFWTDADGNTFLYAVTEFQAAWTGSGQNATGHNLYKYKIDPTKGSDGHLTYVSSVHLDGYLGSQNEVFAGEIQEYQGKIYVSMRSQTNGDSTVHVVHPDTLESVQKIPTPEYPRSLHINASGQLAVAGQNDDNVEIYQLSDDGTLSDENKNSPVLPATNVGKDMAFFVGHFKKPVNSGSLLV
jgi:hypothetical protein